MKKTKKTLEPSTEVINSEPQNSPQVKPFYILLLALILIAGILFRKWNYNSNLDKFKNQVIPNTVKKVVGNPNTKFTVSDIKETNGVYEFILTLGSGNNTQKYTSYITKDGKILFTSGLKIDSLNNAPQTKGASASNNEKKLTCNDLSKTDKSNLTAFIVSNCPFGLQIQRAFNKTINDIPQMISSLNIKYIGSIENNKITSMHGDKEAQENLKQICIREEQKEKYWPYVSCYMQEGKTDDCLNSSQVNQTELNACINDNNRGLKYAKADFDLANKFNVSSSPTLLLNNKQVVSEFDFGGRTVNALKDIVCCGSNTKADFCSKDASKDDVATSFSKTEASANTGNASAASCGQQ